MAKTVESEISFRAIGSFKSKNKISKSQAARQGVEDQFPQDGVIELIGKNNFEQALEGLDGFSHCWILFVFHLNQGWKPKVMPPRFSDKKLGLFATRSPYRPNSLGMTAARIVKIEGRKIYLEGTDLLDGSPILDIKPYIPSADSFPKAKSGWIGNALDKKTMVEFSQVATRQLELLERYGVLDLKNMILQHLESDPFNSSSKRVKALSQKTGVLSIRKWRISFKLTSNAKIIVQEIASNFKTGEKNHNEDGAHAYFLKALRSQKNRRPKPR